MKRRAHWHFHKIDHERKIVFIIDDDGPVSVTNMAEQVTSEAIGEDEDGTDTSAYRLFYRDTMGNWDELVHTRGVFINFAPGGGIIP